MSSEKHQSLQDIRKKHLQDEFVGRQEQLAFFRRNLDYDLGDPRLRPIIGVSGPGGVGKTWLLGRFGQIAEECGAVTAFSDESEEDVPGVMGWIAVQFEEQGHALETFAWRYKVYRQGRQEIEADPEAPQGWAALVGRTSAKGEARLVSLTDEDAVISMGGDFASFVARKIGNKDEVQLMLEPVEVLTPLWLDGMREAAEDRPIVLFFDTYERTGEFLDDWLEDVLAGRYGKVPPNIVFTIAGQEELDRTLWASRGESLAWLPLEPFMEEEARDYLAREGVSDERVVEVILGLSGRLPLLVATLAAESPDDPAKVGDPSGEAVERFLKWLEDPKQRQATLDAALPRRLNRDVLAALMDDAEAEALFNWLREKPFVQERGDALVYHEVVRTQMLRYKRHEYPTSWAEVHGRLAAYYETLRDGLGIDEEAGCKDRTWQGYALEAVYHRLNQAPQAQLAGAINDFVAALDAQRTFGQQWAEVMEHAGRDGGVKGVQDWGRRLVEGVRACKEGRAQEACEMFIALLEEAELETQWRAVACAFLGATLQQLERYEEALADFNCAIELKPDYAWAIARRGAILRQLERYEEALGDFNRAIELKPDDEAIALRGATLWQLERYEEALGDFNRAIELKPDDKKTGAFQDAAWWQTRHYEEVLADLRRAIKLKREEVIILRGVALRLMRRYEEALENLERVIELDPNDAWAIVYRGETLAEMGHYEEALADFNRALELKPGNGEVIALRGATLRLMERYEEALADFDRALELRPDDEWAIAGRGETLRQTRRYEEALADFNRALELKPDYEWAIARRGEILRRMERYEEALADLNRALELKPESDWRFYCRAITYEALGQTEKAQADLSKAIQGARQAYKERPQDWQNAFNLALYYLVVGEAWLAEQLYREGLSSGAKPRQIRGAIGDLKDLLRVLPDHSQARMMRDELQLHLESNCQS